MRNRGLWFLSATGSLVLAMTVAAVWAQNKPGTLPVGSGAIGKGPDALTPPGYEDVPRPPAFTAKTRALAAEQEKAVNNYTPQPAFAGQTRAPKPARITASDQTAAQGLFSPWSFSFLPDGRILVKSNLPRTANRGEGRTIGTVHLWSAARFLQARAAAARFNSGQGLCPEPRHILHYSRSTQGSRRRRPARGRLFRALRRDRNGWARPSLGRRQAVDRCQDAAEHAGDRRTHDPGAGRHLVHRLGPLAGRGILSRNWTQIRQLPGSLMGKVLHINNDGTIPKDNPFVGRAGTRPEIWAFGVRDAQSMAFDARGRLWTAENGPMGGDELNLIDKGKNYGFPVILYGCDNWAS